MHPIYLGALHTSGGGGVEKAVVPDGMTTARGYYCIGKSDKELQLAERVLGFDFHKHFRVDLGDECLRVRCYFWFLVLLIVPRDEALIRVAEKIEDIVVAFSLHSYFTLSGLKVILAVLDSWRAFGVFGLVQRTSCVASSYQKITFSVHILAYSQEAHSTIAGLYTLLPATSITFAATAGGATNMKFPLHVFLVKTKKARQTQEHTSPTNRKLFISLSR
eukprot:evm.model.NODE_3974_length_5509_cov_16.579960.2